MKGKRTTNYDLHEKYEMGDDEAYLIYDFLDVFEKVELVNGIDEWNGLANKLIALNSKFKNEWSYATDHKVV